MADILFRRSNILVSECLFVLEIICLYGFLIYTSNLVGLWYNLAMKLVSITMIDFQVVRECTDIIYHIIPFYLIVNNLILTSVLGFSCFLMWYLLGFICALSF